MGDHPAIARHHHAVAGAADLHLADETPEPIELQVSGDDANGTGRAVARSVNGTV